MAKKLAPSKPVPVWIHGFSGKMGRALQERLLKADGQFHLLGGSSKKFEGDPLYLGKDVTPERLGHALAKAEVIFDFSSPDGNQLLLKGLSKAKLKDKAILIGTTGLSDKQKKAWAQLQKAQNLRLLFAPNTSLGILLIMQAARQIQAVCGGLGFDTEIIETHHRLKKDAPSGTALFLADALKEASPKARILASRIGPHQDHDITIHSVRGGGVIGEHEVRFLGDDEELSLKHNALSRGLFAKGALVMGKWLWQKNSGLYQLKDVRF